MGKFAFEHRWEPVGAHARTLLMLHGTGGDEHDLIDLGRTLDPSANLLSPRGRVSENGANRFFRRFSEGVFDIADLQHQTDALADFVAIASRELGFDGQNVVAVGFSNGANIAASMLLLRPESLAGAVLMRPMVPLKPDVVPDLHGKRILMVNGRFDPIVPVADAEQLAAMFREYGAEVEHLWLETGHNLTREEIVRATDWLAGR